MASQGLPVRKGPLSSCWLLSVIYPSCSCLKDQPLPLPDACSKKVSMQGCQADQLAKSPPLQSTVPRVRSAPGCWPLYSRCFHVVGDMSHITASDSCRQIHVQWSAIQDRLQL